MYLWTKNFPLNFGNHRYPEAGYRYSLWIRFPDRIHFSGGLHARFALVFIALFAACTSRFAMVGLRCGLLTGKVYSASLQSPNDYRGSVVIPPSGVVEDGF